MYAEVSVWLHTFEKNGVTKTFESAGITKETIIKENDLKESDLEGWSHKVTNTGKFTVVEIIF